MNTPPARFPYVERDPSEGPASRQPYFPITFAIGDCSVTSLALLDSGAAVNVLPYAIGIRLGAEWDRQTTVVELTGNLAANEARVLIVSATVANFLPVKLAFAWTRSDSVPIILGQVNFFREFDVCFFGSQGVFELSPRD